MSASLFSIGATEGRSHVCSELSVLLQTDEYTRTQRCLVRCSDAIDRGAIDPRQSWRYLQSDAEGWQTPQLSPCILYVQAGVAVPAMVVPTMLWHYRTVQLIHDKKGQADSV